MIAHGLTLLRLLLALPCGLAFAWPQLLPPGLLLAMIAAAIASDCADGAIARRQGTASPGGQLFDHFADCIFVTACLAGAAHAGLVPALLPLVVLVAFAQYVLDSRLLYRQKRLRMSVLGYWNGILYFVPVVVLALARLDMLAGVAELLEQAARILAWLLVVSSLISIVDRLLTPLLEPVPQRRGKHRARRR